MTIKNMRREIKVSTNQQEQTWTKIDEIIPQLEYGHELQKQISLRRIIVLPDVICSNRSGFCNVLQDVSQYLSQSIQ